jgi:hypothetical protein
MFSGEKNSGGGSVPTSLQRPTECLRSLPCLLVADVGVADRGANVLVAEELLDFPQIFPQVVKQDRGRAVAQPVSCELPYPERPASDSQPQVERAIGKRLARIPRKQALR